MAYKATLGSNFAIGRCDYGAEIVPHDALRFQYEYSGNGLINTGFMACPKCVTKPNPQRLNFDFKQDPVPVENARPAPQTFAPSPPPIVIDVTGKSIIVYGSKKDTLSAFLGCLKINLSGIASDEINLFLPNTFFEIYIDCLYQGDFPARVSIIGYPLITVTLSESSNLVSFSNQILQIVNV